MHEFILLFSLPLCLLRDAYAVLPTDGGLSYPEPDLSTNPYKH